MPVTAEKEDSIIATGSRMAFEPAPEINKDKTGEALSVAKEFEDLEKSVNEEIVKAETGPDEAPVEETKPPAVLKLDIKPTDEETKIEIKTVSTGSNPPDSKKITVVNVSENPDIEKMATPLAVKDPPAIESVPIKVAEVKSTEVPVPATETQKEKIEDVFKNLGEIIMEGWRKYVSEKNEVEKERYIEEVVNRVTEKSIKVNEEQKKQGNEPYDIYGSILNVLKPIINRNFIIKEGGTQAVATQENVQGMSHEDFIRMNLDSLANIGTEYRDNLDEYMITLGEILENRKMDEASLEN